jgi:hypothetical protein
MSRVHDAQPEDTEGFLLHEVFGALLKPVRDLVCTSWCDESVQSIRIHPESVVHLLGVLPALDSSCPW